MFCILPPRLGNMLTDLQIEHINNKTNNNCHLFGEKSIWRSRFSNKGPYHASAYSWTDGGSFRGVINSAHLSGFIFSLFTQQQNTWFDFLFQVLLQDDTKRLNYSPHYTDHQPRARNSSPSLIPLTITHPGDYPMGRYYNMAARKFMYINGKCLDHNLPNKTLVSRSRAAS